MTEEDELRNIRAPTLVRVRVNAACEDERTLPRKTVPRRAYAIKTGVFVTASTEEQ